MFCSLRAPPPFLYYTLNGDKDDLVLKTARCPTYEPTEILQRVDMNKLRSTVYFLAVIILAQGNTSEA